MNDVSYNKNLIRNKFTDDPRLESDSIIDEYLLEQES